MAGEKVGVKCVRVKGQKWREGGSVAGEKVGVRAGREAHPGQGSGSGRSECCQP